MSDIERRWRIFADRAEADLQEVISGIKERHKVTGTLRSGPAIKAIYRGAARLVDGLIERDIHPALRGAGENEAGLARIALEKVVEAGDQAILAHAIWCKAYKGTTKAAVDDLRSMLSDRVHLAFAAGNVIPINIIPTAQPIKTPIPEATLRRWFEIRAASFEGAKAPRWQDCWNAVRAEYPQHSVTRDRLQEVRRAVAPHWGPGKR